MIYDCARISCFTSGMNNSKSLSHISFLLQHRDIRKQITRHDNTFRLPALYACGEAHTRSEGHLLYGGWKYVASGIPLYYRGQRDTSETFPRSLSHFSCLCRDLEHFPTGARCADILGDIMYICETISR
ncbi:hypothetical protein EVAR_12410_1 [Eumeta japonica]|uniref:Uncharacterized protein n=1 Tax=Eumeta variegata TaxID=151549 RepID=A0A4C1TZ93_EUMVA|nr:hypothetical protein EVAR_12410_1 [Eumeta japonica]